MAQAKPKGSQCFDDDRAMWEYWTTSALRHLNSLLSIPQKEKPQKFDLDRDWQVEVRFVPKAVTK